MPQILARIGEAPVLTVGESGDFDQRGGVIRLSVEDSPNSAGVMIDAIRCAKIAKDRGLSGPIVGPSSYFFKTPPKQFRDSICKDMVEAFIQGDSKGDGSKPASAPAKTARTKK